MATEQNPRSVPVHRDKRNLEERYRDLVSNLHRTYRKSRPDSKHNQCNDQFGELDWPCEITRWIDGTTRLWSDVMRRMRENAFVLVPADVSDLESLRAPDPAVPTDNLRALLSHIDRQTQALRRQMSQPAPIHSQGMLTYGDTKNEPFGPIVPQGGLTGGPLGFLKNAFQLGEDGKVKFHLQFDVRGYEPEHIQVKVEKHVLTVHAKKSVRTSSGRSSSEYCRTVFVPSSVDEDKFESFMIEDGVLIVEAPVKQDEPEKIKFDRDLQLGIKPRSGQPLQAPKADRQLANANGEKLPPLQVTGKLGPTILEGGPTNRLLHVEIPVEPGYKADDLSIRVDENRLVVSGRHEVNEGTDTFQGCCVREFSRSYSVPETVDPFSMEAELQGNTVVVEAPLVSAE